MTTEHDYISGGCGTPGKLIQIPVQFLTLNSSSRHKILAHEFFKLRFGVHDEHGYHGDPVYPDHYLHHNKILPTGVSDGEITGQWRTGADTACDKEVDNCLVKGKSHTDCQNYIKVLQQFKVSQAFLLFHHFHGSGCSWSLPVR